MNKLLRNILLSLLLLVFVFSGIASAAWIWTPETKKFTNPKNAVKDTPKEQFGWAMSFYNAKDYQRALFEFEKLAKQYEFSDYASKAQYYVGLCYEDMQKYYLAYENYQKAIDNFPHLANTDEVLAREYAIGLIYLEKPSPKVMGNDIMAPLDRAVEVFKKVVDNAPYGKYAEDAQFKLGEALKKSERYEEAIQAYHKISEDYPNSKYAAQAMYEESHCAYKASLRPAYDASATDNAIKTFGKFVDKNKDAELAKKADSTMKRLKDNVAQKSFDVAKFYESQGKAQAAIIYYQDVIDNYPESSFVNEARARIEALKNQSIRKAAAPIDLSKKKSKEITQGPPKKLSWNLFGPGKKKEEAPKKKGWRPFSFEAKKEKTAQPQAEQPQPVKTPEPVTVAETPKPEAQPQVPETPKTEPVIQQPAQPAKAPETLPATEAPKTEVQPQVPETPKAEPAIAAEAPKAAVVTETPPTETPPTIPATQPVTAEPKTEQVAEAPKIEPVSAAPAAEPAAKISEPAKKKGWLSLDNLNPLKMFGANKEKKKQVEKKPVEKKPWRPFNFEDKKEKKAKTEEVKEPAREKTPWKPFNFENKKEKKPASAEKKPAEKKPWQWKPLYFGTNDEPMVKDAGGKR